MPPSGPVFPKLVPFAAFPVWALAPRLAPGSSLSQGPRTHCWRRRGRVRAGAPGLANWVCGLLLGVWTPGYSETGAWQSARGSTQTAAPPPGAPGPSWLLNPCCWADGSFWLLEGQGREVLVAPYSHPSHADRAGAFHTSLAVHRYPSPTPGCWAASFNLSSVAPLFTHSVNIPEQRPAPGSGPGSKGHTALPGAYTCM